MCSIQLTTFQQRDTKIREVEILRQEEPTRSMSCVPQTLVGSSCEHLVRHLNIVIESLKLLRERRREILSRKIFTPTTKGDRQILLR